MRTLAGLAIIAAVGVAGAANAKDAKDAHMSDVNYMEAARCAGLASSGKLQGGPDAKAMKTMLKSQEQGRMAYILDKADDMQRTAKREADRADDVTRMKLSQELNGVCETLKG